MEYEPINYCFMIWTLVLSHFNLSNFFESLETSASSACVRKIM